MTRRLRRTLIGGLFALGAAFLSWLTSLALAPLPPVLSVGRGQSVIEFADGSLLREPAGHDGLRADWAELENVPRVLVDAMIASEDHRLGQHPGVDPWAIVRALWLDLRHARSVSGASTVAMQLARRVYDLPRTPWGKLEQAARGVVLATRLGRDGVLEAYVNLAPYGRDLRGVRAAARAYFVKPLSDLSVGEATLLACLPRAPSAYDPYRHPERLLRRRAHVLGLMQKRGLLDAARAEAASREPLHVVPFERTFRAPHAGAAALVEARRRGVAHPTHVRTTLVPSLQRESERACRDAVAKLRDAAATGCAAVVLRVDTAEVLALVGSPDFHSEDAGQVNAAFALRQPGSALKPFVYAMAFERGMDPDTLIDDVETHFPAAFGAWVPRNYDGRHHGVVTLREALASSYNIPAVKLVSQLGVDAVVSRLSRVGLSSLHDPARYGLGIALGDAEVQLFELASAYATLARGGEHLVPTLLSAVWSGSARVALPARPKGRVFSERASLRVSEVLADRAARRAAFGRDSVLELPFDAAVKTGTSSSYRDNWTLGYTRELVVAVWVGRHDGASLRGISGVSGAGPAYRRIMLYALGRTGGEVPEGAWLAARE